jgi:hypothetical protein
MQRGRPVTVHGSWLGVVALVLTSLWSGAATAADVGPGAAADTTVALPGDPSAAPVGSPVQPNGMVPPQPVANANVGSGPVVGPPPASWDDWAPCCSACIGWCGNGSCCGGSCGPTECCPPLGRVTAGGPPHPYSYGEVGVVGLIRDSQPSGGPIATLGTGGNVVLSAKEAWPDFGGGGTARLGRMFGPRLGIEFSYLGTGTWKGDAAVADLTANPVPPGGHGNLFSPYGNFGAAPVQDFDYNNLVSIQGRTWLESYELSLRQRLNMPLEPLQVSVFYGLRYIELGERFGYYSQSQVPVPPGAGATQWVDVRTKNDMFGAQLGTLMELHVDQGWWIDARLAAALLNNRAGQRTHHVETGDNPGENWLDNDRSHGTVAAEASVSLVYYLRQNVSAQFGYYFVWMDRVALAAENLETNPTLLREGPGQLDATGTIMFHGPFMGLSVAW